MNTTLCMGCKFDNLYIYNRVALFNREKLPPSSSVIFYIVSNSIVQCISNLKSLITTLWYLCHHLKYMCVFHYSNVIMGTMASQITSITIVYSTVYSGADQREHQRSASLAFVRGIHR